MHSRQKQTVIYQHYSSYNYICLYLGWYLNCILHGTLKAIYPWLEFILHGTLKLHVLYLWLDCIVHDHGALKLLLAGMYTAWGIVCERLIKQCTRI